MQARREAEVRELEEVKKDGELEAALQQLGREKEDEKRKKAEEEKSDHGA